MTDVHRAAAQGFAVAAGAYASGRPDYPGEIVGWLRDALGLRAGQVALDLGAGTGKFTPNLLATGADVIAVEPVASMRAQLSAPMRTQLSTTMPQSRVTSGVDQVLRVLDGTAQAMPLPDACVDAVVCAQAFHWFASRDALREIHRVLRPGGRLGLVWNVRDESIDWVARLTELVTPLEGDAPRFHRGTWREPFDGLLFGALRESVFGYLHTGSAQEVIIDRFMSVSFIAALPDAPRAAFELRLRELVDTHPALCAAGTVAFPYRTHAYWCERLPGVDAGI